MAFEQLVPVATTVGLWAWSQYGDDILQAIAKKVAKGVVDKTTGAVKDAWEQFEWDSAAEKYLTRVRDLHGTIRVLGKPEPVRLEGIFTDLLILDRPTAYRRYDIQKLQEDPTQFEIDSVRREAGLEFVQQATNRRLFILGKPGAGKTTFLKHLALQSTQGKLNRVPIFISLNEWADSGLPLMSYIVRHFDICGFPVALQFVELVLEKGDALVLFDGLDEVRQEESKRSKTISEIRDFSNKYYRTQCLITCRIAASDYTFEQFNYVELADFTDDQIFSFAGKWFHGEPQKYSLFRKELQKPENKRLKELATVPILLTLLCLSFDETLAFPQRRVEVYEEALDALLKKWDASRSIKRDEIYRGLTHNRKRQMLARLAAMTFQQEKYFVPQDELTTLIVDFLRELPSTELTNDIDGEVVLKAIEAQHGILSERAYKIYSFSHLTFQEYFAAKQVVDDVSGKALRGLLGIETVVSDRWREVILMTASLLDNGEVFFDRFQESVVELTSPDSNVVAMFEWANRKALTTGGAELGSGSAENVVKNRLYYICLALIFDTDRSLDRERARARQLAFVRGQEFAQALSFNIDLFRNEQTRLPLTLNQQTADNKALEIDRAFDLSTEFQYRQKPATNSEPTLDLQLTKLQFLADLLDYAVSGNSRRVMIPKFAKYYQNLKKTYKLNLGLELEDIFKRMNAADSEVLNVWKVFTEKLRVSLQQAYDVAYQWRLTTSQVRNVVSILQSTGLMHECLKLAAVKDRQYIEGTLLSPPAVQKPAGAAHDSEFVY